MAELQRELNGIEARLAPISDSTVQRDTADTPLSSWMSSKRDVVSELGERDLQADPQSQLDALMKKLATVQVLYIN